MMSSGDDFENHVEYDIHRNVLSTDEILKKYPPTGKKKKSTLHESVRNKLRGISCSQFVNFVFPSCSKLKSYYSKRLFVSDVLAGLTVSSIHVPQGMAYGQLAGLKPINGIYTSFFPALIYILFGASRHISIGTFSVMSLLVAEPVDRLAESYAFQNETHEQEGRHLEEFRLLVGITVTVLVGIIQFLMGLFHLGLLVVYISPAILGGFTCGAAMHVLASQLNGLFGIRLKRSIGPGRLLFTAKNFCHTVSKSNLVTFALSCTCLVILMLFKFVINPRVRAKFRFSVPIELLLLIVTTTISYFAHLHETYGVAIAGTLPKGLPMPKIPDFSLASQIWVEAFIAAFVSLATTMSVMKLYATRYCYTLDYTKEMSALGLANIFGGFFQCHACSGGLARTSVAVGAGMQSQVATLVSCFVLLLVVTCIGPLLRTLPLCVLSSIILVSLAGILVQLTELPKFYRTSLIDLSVWIVTFLTTVLVDILYGLLTGLMFSLITILYRTHTSERRELGPIPGTDIYLPRKPFDQTNVLPGLVILQTAGPIYFANCESFRDWLVHSAGLDPDLVGIDAAPTAPDSCPDEPRPSEERSCWQTLVERCATRQSQRAGKRFELPELTEQKKKQYSSEDLSNLRTGMEEDKTKSLKFIVIDLSGCLFTDMVGADVLIKLVQAYKKLNIGILFCHCSQHVRSILVNSGFDAAELDKTSFPTIHDAVLHAQHIMNESNIIKADMAVSKQTVEVHYDVFRF